MAQGQAQNSQPATPAAPAAGKSATVRIRVKTGRVLLKRDRVRDGEPVDRDLAPDTYLEVGQAAEVPRAWAERMVKRNFEGYPDPSGKGGSGKLPGIVEDCPIEILSDNAAA